MAAAHVARVRPAAAPRTSSACGALRRARRAADRSRRARRPARLLEHMRIDKKVLGGRVAPGAAAAHRRGLRHARTIRRRRCTRTLAAHCGRRAMNDVDGRAARWRPTRPTTSESRGRRFPESAAGVPRRVPARPRPHHPLQRLPAPRLQDPGVRQSRGRPVPHARHALDRGGADRALGRARAAPERDADRGDLPRARPRPHALRPRRPGRAERVHARLRRVRAQPAVAARRGRARGALRGVSAASTSPSSVARASSSTARCATRASWASSASASSSAGSRASRRRSPTSPTRSPTTTTTSTTASARSCWILRRCAKCACSGASTMPCWRTTRTSGERRLVHEIIRRMINYVVVRFHPARTQAQLVRAQPRSIDDVRVAQASAGDAQ